MYDTTGFPCEQPPWSPPRSRFNFDDIGDTEQDKDHRGGQASCSRVALGHDRAKREDDSDHNPQGSL